MSAPETHADQLDVARLLLDCIRGSDARALIEVRSFRHGRLFRRGFHDDARTARAEALAWSEHADVFVGCLPRFEHGNGTKSSLRYGRMLWADCDSAHAVERLERFAVPPTFVIESGGRDSAVAKCHAWWMTREILSLDAIERVNERIASTLGSDAVVREAARVLRLPGTLHHKTQPARPVRCIDVADDVPIAALVAALPAAVAAPRSVPVPPLRLHPRSSLNRIPATEYVPVLCRHGVGRNGKLHCPLPDHEDSTPSFQVYADEGGWYCFGCERGGDIFTLAALLWGLDPRADFPELRGTLGVMFDIDEGVAA